MASPTDKPVLRAAAVEAPDNVDFIELRKAIRFLNSLDLATFKSYLGIAGEGGGPILSEDIADSTEAGRDVLKAASPAEQRSKLGLWNSAMTRSEPVVWWDPSDLALAEAANVTSWTERVAGRVLSTGSLYPKYFSGGFGGKPWVYFDAATPSNPLTCAAGIFSGSYSALSVALVLRVPEYTATYESPIFCLGTSSPPNVNGAYGNNALALGWYATTDNNTGMAWKVNQGADFGGGSVVTKHRVPFTREMVMLVTFDGAKWSLWVDGVCISSEASSSPVTINGGVAIGSLYTPTGYRNKMSIGVGTIAAWTRGLSPAEVRSISRELLGQSQRRVILMGDSTYEGTASPAGGTLGDVLQAALPGVRVINAARGGVSLATQVAGASPYPEMYGSIGRGDIVILGPGSIDVVNLTSLATIKANDAALTARLQAQGAAVVAPTMIDEYSSADQTTSDANRADLNAWRLAGSSGADHVVDLTGVPEISDNDAHSNSTYFLPDGAHLKAPGIALQAAAILNVLRTVVGPIQAEDIADLREWLMANRKDSYGLESDGGGNAMIHTGSGIAYAQYHATAYVSTGTTDGSRAGFSWGKNSSPCPPGVGHYHYIYWPKPLYVSFRFGFPVTLASGCAVIGYYGTDNTQRPTDLAWAPVYSGFGFQIRGDGSLRIYVDNQDTSTHTLHTTGTTVNVAGAGACLVQELLFFSDGAGSLAVWLNGTLVGTFSGLPTAESANDCYPMIAIFNQASSSTANDLLIFPLEIMVKR